jgi:glycosyltransferase involved in cell wall biosynthesis
VTELISVIVTTYNREDALDAVLRSLAGQTDRNFEVIVGDDGSGPATAKVVAAWQARVPWRLEHVWQADDGFRLAECRNRAILAARGAYLIFLDADCLARPDFVATHRRLAEHGWFVAGNRVLLSQETTAVVLHEGQTPERWPFTRWIGERLRGGINRLSALLHLPLGPLRRLRASAWRGARGCNIAVWRADLDRIDGFDAAFVGWGREDSDFFIRLMRSGVRRKDGNFATGVIHLWHAEANRAALPDNERRLAEMKASDRIRARRGLSALSNDS